MKYKSFILSLMGLLALSDVHADTPLKVVQQKDADGQHLLVTLSNGSQEILGTDWKLYYSVLPMTIKSESEEVTVSEVNGNYFCLTPTDRWRPLLPGQQLTLRLLMPNALEKESQLPEGYFLVDGKGKVQTVEWQNKPFADADLTIGVAQAFLNNAALPEAAPLRPADIIPAVKQVETGQGELLANNATAIEKRINASLSENPEYYRLDIKPDGILIEGASAHGVFNGERTLKALRRIHADRLPVMTITDWPDLAWRGVMLDIARNFTSYGDMLRLLDLLADYKLNTLHLHFADDEGWRIEIPGLPELTEVGGHRGYTTDEQNCLFPGYDGNPDPSANTSGNGFLSREQFISLLRYAAERHIRVMPEIECPGHARAAVISMKARYAKYKNTDPQKASEYLLSEENDTSRYRSVQAYEDNVMNVALPSTYRFMRKVISELDAMYREAGVKLEVLHLGGDEVPKGCWEGSPACHQLMEAQQLKDREALSSYFYAQLIAYLDSLGIPYGGWQDIATAHQPLRNADYAKKAGALNCWTTVAEWGTDELTYQLANDGFPVLLSNVTNCYMDMTYSRHAQERGLDWGGTVDEAVSFSLLPFDGYRSVHTNVQGDSVAWYNRPTNKVMLTEFGKQHVLGVQGQLFAETIRSIADVECCLFPKILGLMERGWNAHPAWEQVEGYAAKQCYETELAQFYARLSQRELPYWQELGLYYHLPNPGLQVKDKMLYANTPYTGVEIRYTLDGTTPTASSPLYEQPIALPADVQVVKACLFKGERESAVSALILDNTK